jgi:hypothetical protein
VASLLQIKKEHAMTRDDTINLAMKAGLLDKVDCSDDYFIPGDALFDEIEAFAELVAAAEREACAKVCDERERANLYGFKECAAAIRARGET